VTIEGGLVLVDANVILDVVTDDPRWGEWSADQLSRVADRSRLAINPIIFAEVSVGFERIEDLDSILSPTDFLRLPLPYEAGFLAGKCFLRYRQGGGSRRSPLPDFYIGAHASVERLTLLTRDSRRYRSYFPGLSLIAPGGSEPEAPVPGP
jgi:predicted nucleic acid-binding protein